MKKFISFALAANIALSMIPATAFASSDLTTSHSKYQSNSKHKFKPKKKKMQVAITEMYHTFY